MFLPVVLAGGSGSRLWPLSRQNYPKQFLALSGTDTMLQQTLGRLEGLTHLAPIIVSNEAHRFIVAEQLRQSHVDNSKIILEPLARNTAPAITLAALEAIAQGQDPILLILAADHYIADSDAFHQAITQALVLAQQDHLVTFGIIPTQAETGYGYIQKGSALEQGFEIQGFKEKPDQQTAQQYVDSGSYLWNSGMFMFKASVFLEELSRLRLDLFNECKVALNAAQADTDFIRIPEAEFALCQSESVDYAVMEHTDKGAVVALDAGWSDLGSWASIYESGPLDKDQNRITGDVLTHETHNCLIQANHRLVATVGLDDLVVVETSDAVLIAHKDDTQSVRAIVDQLKAKNRSEHITHPLVHRPWGHYETIDNGDRYQVKRICVAPGESLSLQMHYHRAEHWVVVSGTALVRCGEEERLISENQSTYIPLGVKHSLSNPGKVLLELVEVQSGSYLGEDDIVRFQDLYGRDKDTPVP